MTAATALQVTCSRFPTLPYLPLLPWIIARYCTPEEKELEIQSEFGNPDGNCRRPAWEVGTKLKIHNFATKAMHSDHCKPSRKQALLPKQRKRSKRNNISASSSRHFLPFLIPSSGSPNRAASLSAGGNPCYVQIPHQQILTQPAAISRGSGRCWPGLIPSWLFPSGDSGKSNRSSASG